MKRRIWLTVLILYAAAAVTDGGYRIIEASRTGERVDPALLAVAFCAGLFWPVDIIARQLLTRG